MSAFDILKIVWRVFRRTKKRGLVDAIVSVFKPDIDKIGREAKNAFDNLLYLDYEVKSIEYDLNNIKEMKEDLDVELHNVKRSFERFKTKTA